MTQNLKSDLNSCYKLLESAVDGLQVHMDRYAEEAPDPRALIRLIAAWNGAAQTYLKLNESEESEDLVYAHLTDAELRALIDA